MIFIVHGVIRIKKSCWAMSLLEKLAAMAARWSWRLVSPLKGRSGAAVAAHKETPSWMDRILNSEFVESLVGKKYSDPFILEQDVDGITGATYTSRAIMEAVMKGSHKWLLGGLPVVEIPTPRSFLARPEIILLLLFSRSVILGINLVLNIRNKSGGDR